MKKNNPLKYSVWFYRAILILILIFIVNIGGIIIFVDTLFNPPLRQPNAHDLDINADENIPFLEENLNKIFPQDIENLSDEDKAIDILRFVVINIKNINNLGTATKILQDGYALCGGKAVVFQTLLRQLMIPTRTVELFNTPDRGHDLVEAYYDQDWHLFDPSYGIFVYSGPTFDKRGNIFSMSKLQKDRGAGFLQGVTDTPWTGQYSIESKVYGVKSLVLVNPTLNNLWRKEIEPADPIIYGHKNLYKYFFMLKTFNTLDLRLKWHQFFSS